MKRFRETGSMDRGHGSGQDRTVFYGRKHGSDRRVGLLTGRAAPYALSTKKNCWTHKNQWVINTENGEKRNLKQLKCLKTSQISEGARNRRETQAGSLRERFKSNICMIEKNGLRRWKQFDSWNSCQSVERLCIW